MAQLLGSAKTSGIFDGQAYITGSGADSSLLPPSQIVFIAAVGIHISSRLFFSCNLNSPQILFKQDAYKLYIPGLNYYQTVRYNALLRVKDPAINTKTVDKAVMAALDMMGLTRYKDRVISERPTTRGLQGGELRCLRIAADIALMPSVIILEEPVHSLDFGVAGELLKKLRSLADLGKFSFVLSDKAAKMHLYDYALHLIGSFNETYSFNLQGEQ